MQVRRFGKLVTDPAPNVDVDLATLYLSVFFSSAPIGPQTVTNVPASSLATLYEVGGRNQRSAEI